MRLASGWVISMWVGLMVAACAGACGGTDTNCGIAPPTGDAGAADQAGPTPDVPVATDATDATDAGGGPTHVLFADRLLNIAHRGGGDRAPENTIVAYEGALAAGADMLEMDVHATSDGVLVVSHDDSVDRTTDGSGYIHQMTLAEIQALDAGYPFSPDGGATYPYRDAGVRIPTLREVFESFPDAYMTIEPKQTAPPIVDALLALIDEMEMGPQVVIGSFDDTKLAAVRAARPELLTGFGAAEVLTFVNLTDAQEAGYTAPGQVLQLPDTAVSEARVAKAHRLGLKLHVWTVNDADDMRRFVDWGVDGIMTDDPVRLQEILVERGLR